MSGKNLIVGQDCTTHWITQKLFPSKSFDLLLNNWELVANYLMIDKVEVKKWKRNELLGMDSLKTLVIDMLDKWVGEKGSEAYLTELINALDFHGMRILADPLRKEMGSLTKPKNYCRYPRSLTEFFSNPKGKNYTIISTLDTSITCEKVEENSNRTILTTDEFLSETSKDWIPPADNNPPTFYVVLVNTLDDCKVVLNTTKKLEEICPVKKLLIISKDPKEKLVSKIPEDVKIDNFVKDEMKWEDLSPIFEREIRRRLQEINNTSETACGHVLVDLINQVEIKLFENTIPEELLVSYYIPRKIITRHRLDKDKLLKNDSKNDIFACSEIGEYTLRGGVTSGMTETSFKLLSGKLDDNIRFVALEESSHFPDICSNTSKSVHLIEFKNGEFYWVKTRGNIETIQKMLKVKPAEEYKEHDDLEHLQETDFVNNVIATDDTRVICLSDTPGMGKSVLLAKIAKQLKDKRDSKTPVIFLSISNLIEKLKDLNNECLKSALHALSCKNTLEEEVISEKLTSSKLEIEFLLDGFDEVDRERSDFALELLQFLQKEYTSIRIWISTRPHHLESLEQALNTIGFNIRPFIEGDQIKFLKSFWLTKKENLDENKLDTLAREVLKKLSTGKSSNNQESGLEMEVAGSPIAGKVLQKPSTGTNRNGQGSVKEIEIAGIPLQCLMLAEIYEEHALVCYGPKKRKVVLKDIDSIATLYKQLVERKFKKYETTYSSHTKLDGASLYSMHYKLALELIFPNLHANITADFFKETINIEELLNVGLLERKNTSSDSNHFIHRTFAEYFCAHFVADRMTKKDLLSCDERFISFFYNEFLSVSLDDSNNYSKFSFCNFVPCYFLNCLILNNKTIPIIPTNQEKSSSTSNVTLPSKNISPEEIRTFLIVCSNHNLQTLFHLFMDLPNFKENECDIIDEEFFLYSSKQHEFEMFEIILNNFKKHSKFKTRLSSKALFATVECFDVKKLQHFLKCKKLFDKILENPNNEFNRWFEIYFIQMHKVRKNIVSIANAIDMINLLVETEKLVRGRIPIICNSMRFENKDLTVYYQRHYWKLAFMDSLTPFQIRLELIKLGANIFQTDEEGNTFLHLYATSDEEYIQYFEEIDKRKPEELTKLVKTKNEDGLTPLASAFKSKVQFSVEAIPEELTKLLKMKNKKGLTPLASAFTRKIQLSDKCLEMFKKAGVDFTEIFKDGPLFLLAIQSGNGREVLQFMIENGVDVYWRKPTYLDCAVAAGNAVAVRMLVTEFDFDLNGLSMNSRSQLDYLFQNWDTYLSEKYFLAAQELWSLGGRLQQTTSEDLKKLAFYRKDLDILRFALENYLYPNEKDSDGNTLLHLLAENWPKAIKLALDFGAKTSEKNKQGLTPLDVALKSRNHIENVLILKPYRGFKWSKVSVSVTLDDFKIFLVRSARTISDWNECLSLFEGVLERSGIKRTRTGFHSLLELFRFPPPQFNLLLKHLCTDQDLIKLLKTVDEYGATPLHYVVQSINGIEVKTLKILQKTMNLRLKDEEGTSLLFYAVEGEQSPDFLELLNKFGGGDFDEKDKDGHGLLHIIFSSGMQDLEMVKFLVKKGADPKSVDHNGETLLHLLLRPTGHEKIDMDYWYLELDNRLQLAEVLLEAGAKPETKNKKGETFFDFGWKIMNKKKKVGNFQRSGIGKVFRLVWKFRDTTDGFSFTCLPLSINQIVEFVFSYWSKLTDEEFVYFTNEILKLKNSMPLDWSKDYFPFIKWKYCLTSSNFHLLLENLIENGRAETFFSLAENEMRALHHVVSKINVEERTLMLLHKLENGSDRNGNILGVKDENERSLLFHAINRYWTTLKYFKLLEKYGGGNIKEKDNTGKSLLHVAVNKDGRLRENSIIVEYLLNNKLDPNEMDNERNTPLHILFDKEWGYTLDENITKAIVLTQAGAKINLKNSNGTTAAELICRNKSDSEKFKENLLAILTIPEDSSLLIY